MSKFKIKIIGEKAKLRYGLNFSWDGYSVGKIYNDYEVTEVWSGELNEPLLKEGEKIYIEELGKCLTIKDVARNTGGGYVCWVYDIFEVIEDEETLRTKVIAETRKAEYERIYEEEKDNRNQEPQVKAESVPDMSNKKWYQFWK